MRKPKSRPKASHWCPNCRGRLLEGPPFVVNGMTYRTVTPCPNSVNLNVQTPPLDARQRQSGEREE